MIDQVRLSITGRLGRRPARADLRCKIPSGFRSRPSRAEQGRPKGAGQGRPFRGACLGLEPRPTRAARPDSDGRPKLNGQRRGFWWVRANMARSALRGLKMTLEALGWSEPRPQLLAANIDVVFIVTALGGDFNLARMERYLALVLESGATPSSWSTRPISPMMSSGRPVRSKGSILMCQSMRSARALRMALAISSNISRATGLWRLSVRRA